MTEQKKQMLQSAGVLVEQALERFMGNEALMERFLKKFPSDPSFSALETALNAGDQDGAFRAAHTLKGVCGNLSLDRLYRLVSEQVEYLRAPGDLAAAMGMMEELRRVYEETCRAIEQDS